LLEFIENQPDSDAIYRDIFENSLSVYKDDRERISKKKEENDDQMINRLSQVILI
tara:strand:+ start:391 stop:555 length:165 start_codon:yes stop_codon:yes gene_type:complete